MSDEIDKIPSWSRKKRDWLLSMVTDIQGKCAVLRHENNKLRAENDRLRRDAVGPYRKLFYEAINHVDSIFLKCKEVPDPILPDFAEPGENKFKACVRLAKEYAAERDTTPVDADWLDGVMGPRHMSPLHGYLEWRSANSEIEVTIYADGSSTVSDGESSYCYIENPTRGDVLTALRLFGGKRK